LTGKLLKS